MTVQSRAFGISLAVHGFAFMLFLAAGAMAPVRKAVVLDFSLGSSPKAGPERAAAAMRRPAPEAQEQKTVTPTVPDEQAVPFKKEQTKEAIKPASDQTAVANQGAAGSDAGTAAGAAEEAKGRYLGAHFVHIRDKIYKHLIYPPMARRMGWAGKVTIAFTVCPDGTVVDISIVESSGFAALDRSAIEAIKRACPLPLPPLKTALIMPVVYRLE